jgi:hypothetical protein
LGPNKSNKNPKSSIKKIENPKTRLIIEVLGFSSSHPVQITTCEGAIALDKYRTLGITIRIETRKCDRNTEMKGDRPNGNFEVLGFAIGRWKLQLINRH